MKAEVPILGNKQPYHVYGRYENSKEALALDHDLGDVGGFKICKFVNS